MTIVQVRGTSGSGKSTLVRAVMDRYKGARLRIKGEVFPGKKRKQPLGYLCIHMQGEVNHRSLFVPGHYETQCGGCDTITNTDRTFELIREAVANNKDVLFEGLLLSAEVNRAAALVELGVPVHTIALMPPLDDCVASIMDRRRAKSGDDVAEVNPKNTESKWKATRSVLPRLEAAGVQVHRFEGELAEVRSAALAKALELLELS